MVGKYSVLVENRSVQFKFEIERNISIIRGDSGTGKTSLIGLIANYQSQGDASGVRLVCDKRCVAMVGLGDAWRNYLEDITDSIIFIDEGERYVATKEFAECIKQSDNYFVIATRNNLYEIPYSVDAIYEVKTSGRKYGALEKTYNSIKKMYGDKVKGENILSQNDLVIVEDRKSGFQFFSKVCDEQYIQCMSADGNSNIMNIVVNSDYDKALIIADGAAFGPEMANVYGLVNRKKYSLFLPESFEWLILNSDIIKAGKIREVLDNPSDYIESKKYFTWEQFFTAFLVDVSKGKEYKYSKSKINPYYLSERNIKKILGKYFSDM